MVSGQIDEPRISNRALRGARRLLRCAWSSGRAPQDGDQNKKNDEAKPRMKSAKQFAQVRIPRLAILSGRRWARQPARDVFSSPAAVVRAGDW